MNNYSITILIFSGYYLPGYKGGGPIKTIKNLVDQADREVSFKLVAKDRDLGELLPYPGVQLCDWNKVGNAEVFYTKPGIIGYKQIIKILKMRDYDMVYLNSFFSFQFSFIPLLIAKFLRKRIILAPRGEFSQGALSLKSYKKNIYINIYKFLRLHKGLTIQASSDYEKKDIQKVLGPKADIKIVENIGAQEFANLIPSHTRDTLNIAFLSRVSPIKNLLGALEILKSVQQPVLYHIYGPIEDETYWMKCETVIERLPAHIHVEYKGELLPKDVIKTLTVYDAFFMPTKGENYGHVIAEALCAGLPILIADTTPWRNLQEQGIGWDLPLSNPDAFTTVIDELALMPINEHQQMRETVLAWAKKKFSQRDAIEANLAMFRYAYEKK